MTNLIYKVGDKCKINPYKHSLGLNPEDYEGYTFCVSSIFTDNKYPYETREVGSRAISIFAAAEIIPYD